MEPLSGRKGSNMSPTLRWTILLPGAMLAGYIAYMVGGLVNRASMTMVIGPVEGWYNFAALFMEHMYLGAAFLYVGGRIAPHHKMFVVLCLSGLLILLVSYSTALVLTQPSSVSLPESISSTAGVVFAAFAMVLVLQKAELDLGEDK